MSEAPEGRKLNRDDTTNKKAPEGRYILQYSFTPPGFNAAFGKFFSIDVPALWAFNA
jgi:hypothetical protein